MSSCATAPIGFSLLLQLQRLGLIIYQYGTVSQASELVQFPIRHFPADLACPCEALQRGLIECFFEPVGPSSSVPIAPRSVADVLRRPASHFRASPLSPRLRGTVSAAA